MKRNLKIATISLFILTSVVALAGFAFVELGFVPINADTRPSALEYAIVPRAVRASVARNAPRDKNPLPPTEENLKTGAEIYRAMCASCHGRVKGRDSAYGATFYPPVPQLPGRSTHYTEGELFWIIKHGIRDTGMPAWASQLSDDDIWQTAAVIKRFDALPPTVEAELTIPQKKNN